jgi:hypothetical protein
MPLTATTFVRTTALTAAPTAEITEDCGPAEVVGLADGPVVVAAVGVADVGTSPGVGAMADVRAGGVVGAERGVAVVGVTVVS